MFPRKSPQAHPLETPLELGDPNCPSSRKLQTTFPEHNTHHAHLERPSTAHWSPPSRTHNCLSGPLSGSLFCMLFRHSLVRGRGSFALLVFSVRRISFGPCRDCACVSNGLSNCLVVAATHQEGIGLNIQTNKWSQCCIMHET